MGTQNVLKTKEELIKQIQNAGQSIIDNAESILGNEKYFLDATISFTVHRHISQESNINVSRNFIPELDIDDMAKEEIKNESND